MGRFGLIMCLLAGLTNSAVAESRLSQEKLAMRINHLSAGEDETSSDVQLGYSGILGPVFISMQVVECTVEIHQFSKMSEDRYSQDMLIAFDLANVHIVKGRDYTSSVASKDGFTASSETDDYYTYSTVADSDRIVANVTFKRNDGANFRYEGIDYFAIHSDPNFNPDDLPWVTLESQLATLIILNPKHERQLQLLVSSLDEYRQRFCMLMS